MRRWWGRLWLALAFFFMRRRAAPTAEDVARIDFPTQTRGRGLRLTERLRDQWRARWLRVRRADESRDEE